MAVLVADAAVSLVAQLLDATHTLGGGLAFALPAAGPSQLNRQRSGSWCRSYDSC
jgi:hypothetical protein